jgi:predicted phosphodiesterase
MEGNFLRFIQISDLHITEYRNLLEPMLDNINSEDVDFVVATGDIANKSDKATIMLASKTLSHIKHKIIVIPGDYDSGKVWIDVFGDRYQSLNLGGYYFEFIDTSFLRHRFAVGWADLLATDDKQQCDWLTDRLELDGYHIIFSHHPMFAEINKQTKSEFLCDNLRCVYSGHFHEPFKLYFPYANPRKHFKYGFTSVPMDFHGSACYLVASIDDKGEIINTPRIISEKKTVW